MSDLWHPILTEEGELSDDATIAAYLTDGAQEPPMFEVAPVDELAAGEPQPSETVAPVTEPAPVQESTVEAQAPMPSADEVQFYKLRKDDLYQEFLRLANEDETFKQRGGEVFGRKAKRDAQTRISELEATIDNLKREQEIAKLQGMEREEVDRRYAEDPEFARRYTDLVHGEPVSVREVAETQYFRATSEDLFEQAKGVRLPDARIKDYETSLVSCGPCRTNQHSFFDHDEDGRLFIEMYADDSIARRAAFDRFRNSIGAEINAVKTANVALRNRPVPTQFPAPAPAAPVAPVDDGAGTPNQDLIANTPDTKTAGNSRPAAGTARYTHEDLIKNYSWEQIFELFPNDGDYERAVEQGIVTLSPA